MTRMSMIPALTASSTTYWMAGLSTTGSISLGWAFVAGRNLVPKPAAGITAFLTLLTDLLPPPGRRRVYPVCSMSRTARTPPSRGTIHPYYRHGDADGRPVRCEERAARTDAPGPGGDPAGRAGGARSQGRSAPAGPSRGARRPDRAPVLFVRPRGSDEGAGPPAPGARAPGPVAVPRRRGHGGRGGQAGEQARGDGLRAEGARRPDGRRSGEDRRRGEPRPGLRSQG